MLQVFHVDVAKVDRDVAYVAMIVHVCCKLLFSMFPLFFQTYVASVFIWMLHMLYTYVASVLSRCCLCFTWFSSVFASVSSVLRRMLQVLHLDVSKLDRVLHLALSSPLTASPRCLHLLSVSAGHPNQRRRWAPPPPLFLDAGGAAGDGLPRVVWTGAPSVSLFRGSIAEIGRLLWQVLDVS